MSLLSSPRSLKLFVGTVCHSHSQSPLQTSGEIHSNQDCLLQLSSCMGSRSNDSIGWFKFVQPMEPSWDKRFLRPEPSLLPSWLKSSTNPTMSLELGAVWVCVEHVATMLPQSAPNQSVHSAFPCIFSLVVIVRQFS